MTIPTPDESGERVMSSEAVQNTDRELWREREGDYYANSIHVTAHGGIGINVGGYVIVKPLAAWHELARRSTDTRTEALEGENKRLREALEKIRRLPSRPFPDPGAHSWRAWGMAVRGAWEDIQSVARLALWPDALKANTPPPREGK